MQKRTEQRSAGDAIPAVFMPALLNGEQLLHAIPPLLATFGAHLRSAQTSCAL